MGEVETLQAVLEQISDGGGPEPVPAVCAAVLAEQSLGAVEARTLSWTVPAESAPSGFGRQYILGFPDEQHAAGRMDQLVAAAEQCASFEWDGPATFETTILEEADGVRALAGVLHTGEGEFDTRLYVGFASVGNVLVDVFQPFTGETSFDADSLAALLRDRASEARAFVIEQLTADPPTERPADAPADASAPWSDWTISLDGVGPVRLGADVPSALAAFEGVQIVEPAYANGPWKIIAPHGVSTLSVQPAPGGTTVGAVVVGADYSHGDVDQDGSALPAASGVRIGAPLAEARAAFPGGTSVTVVSSGEDFYDVATRDGRLLRFRADREASDPAAVVIGITLEDATTREEPVFG
ncbi:hypothetical protein [Microbacterium sp. 179-I 3D4 NHS]|uniref:hypothetical protein n=1 Tax=Microbacterium sp. 179-I 3D4 NHS TaxID=3142381 RepID=UPI0039A3BE42